MGDVVGYSLNRGSLACGVVPTGRDLPWLRRAVLREDKPSWRVGPPQRPRQAGFS